MTAKQKEISLAAEMFIGKQVSINDYLNATIEYVTPIQMGLMAAKISHSNADWGRKHIAIRDIKSIKLYDSTLNKTSNELLQ